MTVKEQLSDYCNNLKSKEELERKAVAIESEYQKKSSDYRESLHERYEAIKGENEKIFNEGSDFLNESEEKFYDIKRLSTDVDSVCEIEHWLNNQLDELPVTAYTDNSKEFYVNEYHSYFEEKKKQLLDIRDSAFENYQSYDGSLKELSEVLENNRANARLRLDEANGNLLEIQSKAGEIREKINGVSRFSDIFSDVTSNITTDVVKWFFIGWFLFSLIVIGGLSFWIGFWSLLIPVAFLLLPPIICFVYVCCKWFKARKNNLRYRDEHLGELRNLERLIPLREDAVNKASSDFVRPDNEYQRMNSLRSDVSSVFSDIVDYYNESLPAMTYCDDEDKAETDYKNAAILYDDQFLSQKEEAISNNESLIEDINNKLKENKLIDKVYHKLAPYYSLNSDKFEDLLLDYPMNDEKELLSAQRDLVAIGENRQRQDALMRQQEEANDILMRQQRDLHRSELRSQLEDLQRKLDVADNSLDYSLIMGQMTRIRNELHDLDC